MLNDLISDGLTRIRNAAMRRLETTKLLHSNVVEATLSILAAKGYIESYNVVEEDKKKFNTRLLLAEKTAVTLKEGLSLLGIKVLEKM